MKILMVRIGRLGDMVMVLPALAALQKQYPGAVIYALTSPDGARLLPCAGIDEANICVYRNALSYRLRDIKKVRRFLNQSFDKIICFEHKPRTCSWLPPTAEILPRAQDLQHYAIRCLQLAGQNLPQWPIKPYLLLDQHKQAALKERLSALDIDDNTLVIGLHPTYSGYGKWGKHAEARHRLWPWANFALVANALSEHAIKHGKKIKIIMDLLPSERRLGEKIAQHSSAELLSLPSGFQRYLCLLARLDLLITPNTGVMHLAAALNTPLVALFSKHDPNDCGPFMDKSRFKVLRAEDSAHPEWGLEGIACEQVVDAAKEFIDRS